MVVGFAQGPMFRAFGAEVAVHATSRDQGQIWKSDPLLGELLLLAVLQISYKVQLNSEGVVLVEICGVAVKVEGPATEETHETW